METQQNIRKEKYEVGCKTYYNRNCNFLKIQNYRRKWKDKVGAIGKNVTTQMFHSKQLSM
jgi:hypothetical protein